MGRYQELSEFQRGAVIGCHQCNKSSREISSFLNITQSTASRVVRKWKCLRMTTTLPRRGRPRKLTERGQRMPIHSATRSPTFCRVNHYRPPNLVPVKGTLNASAYQDILDNSTLPTMWEQFGADPFLFQHDCASVHQWMAESELDWPAQSPHLNPIEHLWDELEQRLSAKCASGVMVKNSYKRTHKPSQKR